jgi:RHS repeat-associated protein
VRILENPQHKPAVKNGAGERLRYIYRAYGSLAAASGDSENPFRFVGQLGYFYDATLLQYYIRARHYRPALARWLSVDPLGYSAGDESLYAYVRNRPVGPIDPTGEKFLGCDPPGPWGKWGPWVHSVNSGNMCTYTKTRYAKKTCYICWVSFTVPVSQSSKPPVGCAKPTNLVFCPRAYPGNFNLTALVQKNGGTCP